MQIAEDTGSVTSGSSISDPPGVKLVEGPLPEVVGLVCELSWGDDGVCGCRG